MGGMKTLLAIAFLALPAVCLGSFIPNYDMQINENYVEDTTPWEEIAVTLPAYPKDGDLVPFDVSSATGNKFMIDAASITVGKDDVVRYTVVIESPRGARTINYEGMRCETMERKIYAFGQTDGKWAENKRAAWEGVKLRTLLSYHKPLYEDIFCNVGIPVRSAEEAMRKLKQPGKEHY